VSPDRPRAPVARPGGGHGRDEQARGRRAAVPALLGDRGVDRDAHRGRHRVARLPPLAGPRRVLRADVARAPRALPRPGARLLGLPLPTRSPPAPAGSPARVPGLARCAGVLGNVGFEGALIYYNAWLPELAPPGKQGRLSGWGFAVGYAGSIVALAVAFPLVRADAYGATFSSAAVLFGIFALPSFFLLPA